METPMLVETNNSRPNISLVQKLRVKSKELITILLKLEEISMPTAITLDSPEKLMLVETKILSLIIFLVMLLKVKSKELIIIEIR